MFTVHGSIQLRLDFIDTLGQVFPWGEDAEQLTDCVCVGRQRGLLSFYLVSQGCGQRVVAEKESLGHLKMRKAIHNLMNEWTEHHNNIQ